MTKNADLGFIHGPMDAFIVATGKRASSTDWPSIKPKVQLPIILVTFHELCQGLVFSRTVNASNGSLLTIKSNFQNRKRILKRVWREKTRNRKK